MQRSRSPRGLVLLGCGKMGSAHARRAGWQRGLPASSVWVTDPQPSDWLSATGRASEHGPAGRPRRGAGRGQAADDGRGPARAAGAREWRDALRLRRRRHRRSRPSSGCWATSTPVVRAMPNTPAAIGRGITAMVGNAHASEGDLDAAEELLRAVGEVVRLEDERQMDAVTGVSAAPARPMSFT